MGVVDVGNQLECCRSIASKVWEFTGYRFTYVLHIPGFYANSLFRIHRTQPNAHGVSQLWYCCQSLEHVKQPKPCQTLGVKHRETEGMDRFKCQGELNIRIKEHWRDPTRLTTMISMKHQVRHVTYTDISMPSKALSFIQEKFNSTPGAIAADLVKRYPKITPKQVHTAWSRHSEKFWRRDDNALHSAAKLLKEFTGEVDHWELEVPDGVVAVAWGARTVAHRIASQLVEVGLDATCEYFRIL